MPLNLRLLRLFKKKSSFQVTNRLHELKTFERRLCQQLEESRIQMSLRMEEAKTKVQGAEKELER